MPKFDEPPEVQEAPPERLYCFLNQDRVCSSDCVAFYIEGELGVDKCIALRSVVKISYFARLAHKVYSDGVADAQRTENASVDSFGRPQ